MSELAALHRSIHHKHLPLSFGVEEEIIRSILEFREAHQNEDLDEVLFSDFVRTACCLAFDAERVEQELPELVATFLDRMHEAQSAADAASAPQDRPSRKPEKTFGYALEEWSKTLTGEQLCLLLADHDPLRAQTLYWEVDKPLVLQAVESKLRYQYACGQVSFEACLFGFGGSYGDGSDPVGGNVAEFDLSEGEGQRALKSLGL